MKDEVRIATSKLEPLRALRSLLVLGVVSLACLEGSIVWAAVLHPSPFVLRPSQRGPITSPIDPEVERLAKHDLEAAKFYFNRRKAYKGARERLLEIAAAYPEFTRIDEVYFLLGECFVKTSEPESARKFFELLLTERPESEFAERARKRIAELPPAPPATSVRESP